jgi:hypothetical protein
MLLQCPVGRLNDGLFRKKVCIYLFGIKVGGATIRKTMQIIGRVGNITPAYYVIYLFNSNLVCDVRLGFNVKHVSS